jgi:hypothetical protein
MPGEWEEKLTRDPRFRGFPWHISAPVVHEEKCPLRHEGWDIFADLYPEKRQRRSRVQSHNIHNMINLRHFPDGR